MQAELDDILGQPLLLLSYPLKAESAGSLSFLVCNKAYYTNIR